jgi:hypothetical protein
MCARQLAPIRLQQQPRSLPVSRSVRSMNKTLLLRSVLQDDSAHDAIQLIYSSFVGALVVVGEWALDVVAGDVGTVLTRRRARRVDGKSYTAGGITTRSYERHHEVVFRTVNSRAPLCEDVWRASGVRSALQAGWGKTVRYYTSRHLLRQLRIRNR